MDDQGPTHLDVIAADLGAPLDGESLPIGVVTVSPQLHNAGRCLLLEFDFIIIAVMAEARNRNAMSRPKRIPFFVQPLENKYTYSIFFPFEINIYSTSERERER